MMFLKWRTRETAQQTGTKPTTTPCTSCEGTGRLVLPVYDVDGGIAHAPDDPCPHCSGSGSQIPLWMS